MVRRQLQIKGTERTEVPDVEKAAEAYREVRDERCELSKREAQKKLELLAVMKAHKLKLYRYHDENGEELEAIIDDEPKVKVRKTGEAESEVGEGIGESRGTMGGPEHVPGGLIAQALKSQDDSGVEEDESGDVVVPDKAAPKAKRKGRKAK